MAWSRTMATKKNPRHKKKAKKKKASKKIKTGSYRVEETIKDNRTKETLSRRQAAGDISGPLADYVKLAAELDVSLDTLMRTLPRGRFGMGSTYSDSATYSSVRVDASLEMTFPGFGNATSKATYEQLAAKMEYVVGKALEDARDAADI